MANTLFDNSYSLALDLDKKIHNERGNGFLPKEFEYVTTVLQYPKTENGQLKFFNVLNNLSSEDLIERARSVSRLVACLKSIEKNKRQ